MSSFQTGSFIRASQLQSSGSQSSSQRRTKAQLWNELKVTSLTRAFTLIYSLSLLTILTRIQLNLLGRLNYMSSVVSLAQPPPPARESSISLVDNDDSGGAAGFGDDFETNRRYLTFSWFLLHKGYAQILAKIRQAVEEVFGGISPNEGITATRLSELVLEVRKKVEGSSERERYATRWLPYMLPPKEEEVSVLIESGVLHPSATSPGSEFQHGEQQEAGTHVDTSTGPLRQLLDETADLIDSPTFTRIHTLILGSMFSHLIDDRIIKEQYPQPRPHSPSSSMSSAQHPRIQELDSSVTVVPGEPRVKLANILATITREAHAIGNGNNPPNQYVATAEAEVKELEAFAAVIYASNTDQKLEESRPDRTNNGGLKASEGIGVGDVGVEPVEETIQDELESAWTTITGSVSFSSRQDSSLG